MGAGRYAYLQDFYKSLQRGKVKLDFADKPLSAREKAAEEAREKAVQIIGRSMAIGGVLVLVCFGVAWQMTKWYLGVSSVSEFNEAMRRRLPKVTNEAKDSMVGRQLKDVTESSRDTISESEALTAWRRQVRGQFNTPEGAAIARKNSILMAEKRREERVMRKASKANNADQTVTSTAAAAVTGGVDLAVAADTPTEPVEHVADATDNTEPLAAAEEVAPIVTPAASVSPDNLEGASRPLLVDEGVRAPPSTSPTNLATPQP